MKNLSLDLLVQLSGQLGKEERKQNFWISSLNFERTCSLWSGKLFKKCLTRKNSSEKNEVMWISYIQNAGEALNTQLQHMINHIPPAAAPVSDVIFVSAETVSKNMYSLLPQYMQLSPSKPSDQFLYSHYFNISHHCFLLWKGGVTTGRRAWTSVSYTVQSRTA